MIKVSWNISGVSNSEYTVITFNYPDYSDVILPATAGILEVNGCKIYMMAMCGCAMIYYFKEGYSLPY
jgi:uncharacterized Fe-S cluster-containing MiaB family protein